MNQLVALRGGEPGSGSRGAWKSLRLECTNTAPCHVGLDLDVHFKNTLSVRSCPSPSPPSLFDGVASTSSSSSSSPDTWQASANSTGTHMHGMHGEMPVFAITRYTQSEQPCCTCCSLLCREWINIFTHMSAHTHEWRLPHLSISKCTYRHVGIPSSHHGWQFISNY